MLKAMLALVTTIVVQLQAGALLLLVRLALWLLPFRWLWAVLLRSARARRSPSSSLPLRTTQIVAAVDSASIYIPYTTCLVRAMTGFLLLRWYGAPVTLRIGVARRDAAQIDAHAWIESDGAVLIGGAADELAQYRPMLVVEG